MPALGSVRSGTSTGHQALRYALAGGTVTVTNLGLGLALAEPLPIQLAIPIAYVLSACLHFVLQRHFVFHGTDFVLPMHHQALMYVPIGVTQYAFTAVCTAVVPSWLDVEERAVFVVAALTAAAATFVFLRLRVFHGSTRELP